VSDSPDNGIEHTPRPGYIIDYISGGEVRATPEEVDGTQVFSRRLVEDYGYPKDNIQTRPQFRVRRSPSDDRRSFPVDIALFRSAGRTESDLYLVAESKAPNKKKGREQLQLYMDMSATALGVWFNGSDHLYLRKHVRRDGTTTYTELPNIPRFGQRLEDIGLFQRKDLVPPSNLKAVFKDIRNHLAGSVTGITRAEALAQEIINLLFCKIYDELNTGKDDMVSFRSGFEEPATSVAERIEKLFDHVKTEYDDVFARTDRIRLDADSILYVVGELQNYTVTEADRDAVGDAFEVFIGPALRGAEGQFFTPRNVIKMMVGMLDPKPGQMVVDPACGSGGFLINALEHVWAGIDLEGEAKGWSPLQTDRKKRANATRYFRGIDKDAFLAKVTKAYMAIVGDGRGGVFCDNSLLPPSQWQPETAAKVKLGSFDAVLTNPPFWQEYQDQGIGDPFPIRTWPPA